MRKINHFLKKTYCQIPQKVVKWLLEQNNIKNGQIL
mgnify:CR=1 FL=1